jgi:hypothetical protein
VSESTHAARRRRDRGAAAVLTVRSARIPDAAARRRSMAVHPAGVADAAARQRSMAAHPAGRTRQVTPEGTLAGSSSR